jgi:hypothetical protein
MKCAELTIRPAQLKTYNTHVRASSRRGEDFRGRVRTSPRPYLVVGWFARDSLIENNREQNGATQASWVLYRHIARLCNSRIGVDCLPMNFCLPILLSWETGENSQRKVGWQRDQI